MLFQYLHYACIIFLDSLLEHFLLYQGIFTTKVTALLESIDPSKLMTVFIVGRVFTVCV